MKQNLIYRGLALIAFFAVLLIASLFFTKHWGESASIEGYTNSLLIVYIAIVPSLIVIFTKKWKSSYVGLIFFVALTFIFMTPSDGNENGGASFEPLIIASAGFFSCVFGVAAGILILKDDT